MAEPVRPDPDEFDHGPLSRTPQEDWEFAGARELQDWVQTLTEQLRETADWPMTPGSFENLFIGSSRAGRRRTVRRCCSATAATASKRRC